jgi:hypothetical protein
VVDIDLSARLREHLERPFPSSVEKGVDYGTVDPVMIDADIYGWASRVAAGETLSEDDQARLNVAHDQLIASLDAFPEDARPYYEAVAQIAAAAIRT